MWWWMTSTIAPLLEGFSDHAIAAKDELRTYASCDPVGFREEALPVVKNGADSTARRYLIHLLLKYAYLAEYLSDPAQSTNEEAVVAAKAAHELAAPLEAALERILSVAVRDSNAAPVIIRIID